MNTNRIVHTQRIGSRVLVTLDEQGIVTLTIDGHAATLNIGEAAALEAALLDVVDMVPGPLPPLPGEEDDPPGIPIGLGLLPAPPLP